MATRREIFTSLSMVIVVATRLLLFATCAVDGPLIGINYGRNGDNLPAPSDVITLLKRNGVQVVRIYDPNPDILNALRGSSNGIEVSIGVKNTDITKLARSLDAASLWVDDNILRYKIFRVTFYMIVVGDAVIPGAFSGDVAQAMNNLKKSLVEAGLPQILVTTATGFNLAKSFPPSAGTFPRNIVQIMKNVTDVLRKNASPLLVSIFPYVAYASDPKHISLEYATFRADKPIVDGQYQYYSLLEAQMDAYYVALEKIGAGDVPIVVAATGWPTAGKAPYTSVANAQAYNTNLLKRMKTKKGTPRAPTTTLDAFISSVFDENKNRVGIEQHWGVFTPKLEPKYPLFS